MQQVDLLIGKMLEMFAPAWKVLLQEYVARQLISGFLPLLFGICALCGIGVCLWRAAREFNTQNDDEACWYIFLSVALYWLGLVLCACGVTTLVDAYFAPNLRLLLSLL